MPTHVVPQPARERIVPLRGHPLVVGVVPRQPELVPLTAAAWAAATGATELYLAYVDPARYTREEYPDGSVWHDDVDPDGGDATLWEDTQRDIEASLARVLADSGVPWHFRYLAGRPDRALTHLARAVDAAGFVIGTRAPGAGARLREAVEGSVAVRLTHHQHRPVLVVPLRVVDWAEHPWRRSG
ncbi:universal stress protein [Cellulomonas carbonis]|uniref:Universal stress protein UspA n=1 Tax=Cellulomonas carbonis T26 TaxID=947969 RepID=A0A0A0BNS1_9CELL|nr:universal stress protein [Cellulomonas carbonis]KGM09595.1 universal stress protein UspA [Cellulomonas carbonis T26]GGC07373.1 hypothetical protein GCM10010972_20900 [Cellulomonas carbonis]